MLWNMNLRAKKIGIFIVVSSIFLFSLFFGRNIVSADTPSPSPSPSSSPGSCVTTVQTCLDNNITSCSDCVNYLNGQISEKQGQEKTLSSQIAIMDSQINLTEARIEATQEQITSLTLDIDTASKKISSLETSLTGLVNVLANRIVATYEVGTIQPLQILLTSGSAADFFTRLNYLKIAQAHDKELIYNTEQAKVDYSNQKNILEDEKKKVVALETQLQAYSDQLNQEKATKQELLTQTQGSEATYQSLLAQAKAQLAAISGFVQSQGGLTLINADPSWPSDYFSQRDTRWGDVPIAGYYDPGTPVYSIGEAGCLVSSVAMVIAHKGGSATPLTIGTNGSYFIDASFQWNSLVSLGFNAPLRTLDTSIVDNYLSQNKWVIVGISSQDRTDTQPFHFVVITAKNGNDYNLFDPWRGPNVSFNSNYGSDYITEVITY